MSAPGSGARQARTWAALALTATILVTSTAFAVAGSTSAHAGPSPASPSQVATADPLPGGYIPVMVVMDTSGSMGDPARSGGAAKIDAARGAVNAVASAVGPNQQLGVIAYPGSTEGSSGCAPGDVVVPLGAPDPALTSAAVRGLRADGGTPTSAALEHAGQLLTSSGADRSVAVLVSDGEANCGPPVCETAKKLLAQGVHVTINTVGFDIANDADAQQDLRCVADATGGAYADASDAAALQEALLRAAASYLDIKATVPAEATAVTGTSGGLGVNAQVTVTNAGQQLAQDVQVSLDFAEGKRGGVVPIGKPVQFAGNLAPGASRTFEFQVRPPPDTVDRMLSWVSAATTKDGRGAQASGVMMVKAAGSALGPVLDVDGPIVVVGDSYSAGEGTYEYLPGTDGGRAANQCHRSNRAYAAVLFGKDRVHNLACSGALTDEYGANRQTSGNTTVELQSVQLQELVDSEDPPALVLLTFGGNDIGFGDVVARCAVYLGKCSYKWGQDLLATVPDIASSLVVTYEQIDDQVNSPEVITKREGRVAPIVVLPYVRSLPEDDAHAPGNCFFGFSGDEVRFLNALLNKLNATIRRAVQHEADAGRPFYFATDVIDSFQPNHTVCDDYDHQYANTSRARMNELPIEAALRAQLLGKEELVHPNVAGYEAEAQALAGWSQHTRLRPVTGQPLWDPLPTSNHPILNGIDIGAGSLQPAGGTVTVQGTGFEPGSQVIIRLESVPRVVGTSTARADGTVKAIATIPFSTPVGSHNVVLLGFGTNGQYRTDSHPIRVLPGSTGVALLLLLLGIGLVGVWSWTSPRRKKVRNTSEVAPEARPT